mmetsp:Transcript_29244/g.63605  ORF Transcript_29244/g.63605 Transcript_29244/m.63605 type:complete len:535 (+) Transcript_29244:80-1684(+)
MFFETELSEVGRASAQALNALRRQLGVGIDPAFDYSLMAKNQKKLAKKLEGRNKSEKDEEQGPPSGMQQLRRALREVAGSTSPDEVEDEEADLMLPGQGLPAAPAHKKASAASRPSPAFTATSRAYLERLNSHVHNRAPAADTYRPKDELLSSRPRVQNISFGLPERTKGLKLLRAEKELMKLQAERQNIHELSKRSVSTDFSEDFPERMRKRLPNFCIDRMVPRPDIVDQAGLVYNVNSFTTGVLNGDLGCSWNKRIPSWDFTKSSTVTPKLRETYFQPGQYQVKLEIVRPRLSNLVSFDKQRARKPLKETVGSLEIDKREGDHLPDRSLSRSCPILSTTRTVQTPILAKGSPRPDIVSTRTTPGCIQYHCASDPAIDQAVLQRSLEFDAFKAQKFMKPRTKPGESFANSLKRHQHLSSMRVYGEDVAMARARENLRKGPVSVELLSEVDCSPSLRRRVTTKDFSTMHGRENEARKPQSPPRLKLSASGKFQRGILKGNSRCDLSLDARSIARSGSSGSARVYVELPVAEHHD